MSDPLNPFQTCCVPFIRRQDATIKGRVYVTVPASCTRVDAPTIGSKIRWSVSKSVDACVARYMTH